MEASHIEKNRIKYVDILKSEHNQTKKNNWKLTAQIDNSMHSEERVFKGCLLYSTKGNTYILSLKPSWNVDEATDSINRPRSS